MPTTAALIQQVRNLLAYDFEVPIDDPDSVITDALIMSYLNISQDELARTIRLYSPSIPFSIDPCSAIELTDSSFSKRIDSVSRILLSTGEEMPIGDISEYNPAISTSATSSRAFIDSGVVYFDPAISAATTGFIQGFYLPDLLTSINSSGLPSEIADRHLARYCVAENANAFAIENQQLTRLQIMGSEAAEACRKYTAKNRMNRKTISKPSPTYRV